jgi:hypothetical protein
VARTADTDTTSAPALEPDEGEALDALMLDDVVITPPEDPLPLPDPLPTAPPDTTDQ